jgi:hypothetical protein
VRGGLRCDFRTEHEDDLTGGSDLSAGEREEAGYRFGIKEDGPRAVSGAGPEWFPEAFSLFFLFLSIFLFFLFLFLS